MPYALLKWVHRSIMLWTVVFISSGLGESFFKCIFMIEKYFTEIVPKGPIENKVTLVQAR